MVELMVVVAILALTAALAVTGMKSNPVGNDARKVAALMATANRTAIGGGPIRTDVAATGVRQRAVLEILGYTNGYQLTVYKVVENPGATDGTFTYVPVSSELLNQDTEVWALGATAATLPTGVDPAQTDFSPPVAPALGPHKKYFPDGTAEAMTIYLRHKVSDVVTRYRIVALPLSPAPQVFTDW
jgi:hypothetical protein